MTQCSSTTQCGKSKIWSESPDAPPVTGRLEFLGSLGWGGGSVAALPSALGRPAPSLRLELSASVCDAVPCPVFKQGGGSRSQLPAPAGAGRPPGPEGFRELDA